MGECDHTVGLVNSEYDGTSWFVLASEEADPFFDVDVKFSFCPNCGASLKRFWEIND